MSEPLQLSIGGIRFVIGCDEPGIAEDADPAYAPFLRRSSDSPEVLTIPVRLSTGLVPEMREDRKVFDTGQSWALYREETARTWQFRRPGYDENPYCAATLDEGAPSLHVRCDEVLLREGGQFLNPLRYPLDQLLVVHVLARHGGIVLHALGLEYKNRGYLFAGCSGAGKTTLARLLGGDPKLALLSDDRMVLRKAADTMMIYGTPWPGEAGVAENRSAVLEGLFFLRRAGDNSLHELSRDGVFDALLPLVSIPWYDEDAANPIVSLCAEVASSVPGYALSFKPDSGASAFLRSALDGATGGRYQS